MRQLFFFILIATTFTLNAQYFNWSPLVSNTSHTLNDLSFISDQIGYAVGVNGTTLKTTNGGGTWIKQTTGTQEPLNCVFFKNDSIGWIGGGSSQALLLKTNDGGTTWNTVPTSISSGPVVDLAFAPNGNDGFLITSDSIYSSTNGGINWEKETYGNFLGTAVNSCLVIRNSSLAFVGGRRFQTGVQDSSPEVYDRRNGSNGYTWEATSNNQFSNMDRIESMYFSTDSTAFAGGIQGKLYCLNASLPDLSGPWTICEDLGAGNNQTINSISFANADTGMFSTPKQMGAKSFSLVYHTMDNGASWNEVDTIPNFLINRMQYVDDYTAYAVGNNGKIYKATHPSASQFEYGQLKGVKVYPNPVELELNISVFPQENYELTIFDLSGKLFVKLLIQAKETSTVNVSHIKPGMYLAILKSENGIISFQKFVKL